MIIEKSKPMTVEEQAKAINLIRRAVETVIPGNDGCDYTIMDGSDSKLPVDIHQFLIEHGQGIPRDF